MVWSAGKKLFGERYTIVRKLGEGGIGITYLAVNEENQPRVIKTLRQEVLRDPQWKTQQKKLRQDFRDEAVRLAVCRHPHVVQIENIFDDGDLPCMVMEYIEGEDLGRYIQKTGALPESEALLYIRQIGDALTVVHRKGLLHRDIKPRNIMLRRGKPEAVLIDFGIARDFVPNVVQRHTVYRTPGFAPPEQYQLEAARGEYIDVYALAATLYNLLTGVMPTSADDRRHIPLQPPQSLNPNISDKVNQAVMRGMALKANYRPHSVQEWLNLLDTDGDPGLSAVTPTRIITPDESSQVPINTDERSSSYQSPPLSFGRGVSSASSANVEFNIWQCIHTLQGHGGQVHSVAITPVSLQSSKGFLDAIASGSSDKTIKLWDLGTGQLLRSFGKWFFGHSSLIHQVAFNYNGEVLASASWDETIKLWQVNSGKEIRTLKGHTNSVNSVTFSPNGKLLASASADFTIKLWEINTGREVTTFVGHSESVWSVSWSPFPVNFPNGFGLLLASGGADFTIKLWEINTGREVSTLEGHSLFVNTVAFSPNGQLLASGSSDNTIKIWDTSTGREIYTLEGHFDSVWSLAWSPDGQLLASGSWDNTIKIWLVSSGKEIACLVGHDNYVRSVAWGPGGRTIVSGSDDATIKIWERS
ncbi:MAG: serine/threonine-protein kinase [Cyanobacteria bacterium J06639_18]